MEYKDSGVDRNAAYSLVDGIQSKTRATYRDEVLSEIGDFGAFFRAPSYLREPVFVAATDGVGTKLMLAELVGGGAHRSVGVDAVAMCVNDLLACRAEPIVFLDYIATGKLDPAAMNFLIDGIVQGCQESGCALIGGETAQMPGFYPPGRYDVAGFSIGALERADRWNPSDIAAGDIVVGIEASGFHSNGFSLVRKVIEKQKWKLEDVFEGKSLADWLLEPTRLYVKPVLDLFKKFRVKGAANITGGGLIDNLPRAFRENQFRARLVEKKISVPAMVQRFVEAANLKRDEAFSTWKMGVGFCVILEASEAERLLAQPTALPWKFFELGEIEPRPTNLPASAAAVYFE